MKTNEFIKKVENYYGILYRYAQIEELENYLGSLGEIWMRQLFDMIIRQFSVVNKFLPDIAIFEQIRKDFEANGVDLKKGHSERILNMEDEIVPKGLAAKPYFDNFWQSLPKVAQAQRSCDWGCNDKEEFLTNKL